MTADAQELENLMKLALNGDKRAYETALRQCASLLKPFIAKRLNHKHEIDDVLQEIILSVHKARHTYDGQRPFTPWLYAIARFRLKDYLRLHYKDHLRQAEELTGKEQISAADVTESGIAYESIREDIRQLPEKQATIIELMHGEGYTAKEVAHKMGMSESAVKVAAHRAYKILRKKLEQP